MQQTFVQIDESWLDIILLIWCLAGVITLVVIGLRKGIQSEFWGMLPVFVVGALIIRFVVPFVMIEDPVDGEGRVLAIRGYGFFLLLGVISGVGLAMQRSRRMGLHPDVTLNLCFWLFACGIAGARLFYVIQYWPQFQVNGSVSWAKILNMTEGGLVVYGSIIGGAIGGVFYIRNKSLPVLPVMDILAPCMMIGLAIGRIGCLMNGCCWGGICEDSSFSLRFPEGSPPYIRHVETGELFGMKAPPIREQDQGNLLEREIEKVIPGSAADKAGIKKGDRIVAFGYDPNPNDNRLPDRIVYRIRTPQGVREVVFENEQHQVPARSLPVYPAQIYASINAFFVFLFLWFFFPCRTRDGQVLGLLMIVYPVGRFLLEMIRSDELGQFGTQLTISQITSIGSILGGIVLIASGFLWLQKTDVITGPKSSDPA